MSHILYNVILILAALIGIPYYAARMAFTGKYRQSLGPKFGFNPPEIFSSLKGSPRIWFHAVSVGEVTAAAPVIAAVRKALPEACIVLSTSTETGQEMARKIVPAVDAYLYYPLDIPRVVRKVVGLVKPDIFIPTETELWPNFITACKRLGTRIILVNGRISPRSFRRYMSTRFFWRKVLSDVDAAGVITEVDGQRLRAIGMAPGRIRVCGNAKYDSLAAKVSPALKDEMAHRLNLNPLEPVVVAGSTHEGEEKVVLEVFGGLLKRWPEFKLILVPRHIERAAAVRELAVNYGYADVIAMTEINGGRRRQDERVVLVDVIGELFKLYSLATVVYCGGSLVPRGGQNILEAAAWGKCVFYGPHMDDFREERELLE
ncbi:MAG: 3-deoxy-D-manno-octulosonic acid transferase, partial [Smithellaceae bacterium]|nr:3-deoxy-D-manno-octulosonic acid transferase [Smithellaceae bacterium]